MSTNRFSPTAPAHLAGAGVVRILLVDDDQAMRLMISLALTQAGYQILAVANGAEALAQFARQRFDLVLLDVNLPGMDGYEVCRALRQRTTAPILFLFTACSLDERVRGFELGADGYLTKPFTLQLLRARVAALLARARQMRPEPATPGIALGTIHLDEWTQQVTVRGEPRHITVQEFKLLQYLMHHPDCPVTKEKLRTVIWPTDRLVSPEDDFNRLRVMVNRLRRKIEEDPAHPRYLKTIPGVGYQFCSMALPV